MTLENEVNSIIYPFAREKDFILLVNLISIFPCSRNVQEKIGCEKLAFLSHSFASLGLLHSVRTFSLLAADCLHRGVWSVWET